jgi:hypothetical protein
LMEIFFCYKVISLYGGRFPWEEVITLDDVFSVRRLSPLLGSCKANKAIPFFVRQWIRQSTCKGFWISYVNHYHFCHIIG